MPGVTATLEGWAEYIKGGPAIEAANAQIKKDNPDMTDDKMAYAQAVDVARLSKM